jgi:hypothetical protein
MTRIGKILAEVRTIQIGDVSSMSAAQINKLLDRIDQESSEITKEFIDSGRGYERSNDILKQTDPLSVRYRENWEKRMALRNEMERRYGPNTPSRLPKGFGPIKQMW